MRTEQWALLEPENEHPIGLIDLESTLNADEGALIFFRIHSGNLWEAWHEQHALLARTAHGEVRPARIAAYPATAHATGLLRLE